MGVLPYINHQLGGDVQSLAILQSTYAGLGVVGGLAVGTLHDRIGTKKSLLLTHISTMANATVFSGARSWIVLYSSSLTGLTSHGYQAASQVAVKCSDQQHRQVALSR